MLFKYLIFQPKNVFSRRIWFSAKSGVSNIFVAIGLCAFFFLLLRHYFRNSASSNNLNADMDDFVDELDPPINIEEDIWSGKPKRLYLRLQFNFC